MTAASYPLHMTKIRFGDTKEKSLVTCYKHYIRKHVCMYEIRFLKITSNLADFDSIFR